MFYGILFGEENGCLTHLEERGGVYGGRTAALCHCALVFRGHLSRRFSDDVIRQTEKKLKKKKTLSRWFITFASDCSF